MRRCGLPPAPSRPAPTTCTSTKAIAGAGFPQGHFQLPELEHEGFGIFHTVRPGQHPTVRGSRRRRSTLGTSTAVNVAYPSDLVDGPQVTAPGSRKRPRHQWPVKRSGGSTQAHARPQFLPGPCDLDQEGRRRQDDHGQFGQASENSNFKLRRRRGSGASHTVEGAHLFDEHHQQWHAGCLVGHCQPGYSVEGVDLATTCRSRSTARMPASVTMTTVAPPCPVTLSGSSSSATGACDRLAWTTTGGTEDDGLTAFLHRRHGLQLGLQRGCCRPHHQQGRRNDRRREQRQHSRPPARCSSGRPTPSAWSEQGQLRRGTGTATGDVVPSLTVPRRAPRQIAAGTCNLRRRPPRHQVGRHELQRRIPGTPALRLRAHLLRLAPWTTPPQLHDDDWERRRACQRQMQ